MCVLGGGGWGGGAYAEAPGSLEITVLAAGFQFPLGECPKFTLRKKKKKKKVWDNVEMFQLCKVHHYM